MAVYLNLPYGGKCKMAVFLKLQHGGILKYGNCAGSLNYMMMVFLKLEDCGFCEKIPPHLKHHHIQNTAILHKFKYTARSPYFFVF
jgi:hypothetical protein